MLKRILRALFPEAPETIDPFETLEVENTPEPHMYEKFLIRANLSEFQKAEYDIWSRELPDSSFRQVVQGLTYVAVNLKTENRFPHYNFDKIGVYYVSDFFVNADSPEVVEDYNSAVKTILTWYVDNLAKRYGSSDISYAIRTIETCIVKILQPLSETTSEICRYPGEPGNSSSL